MKVLKSLLAISLAFILSVNITPVFAYQEGEEIVGDNSTDDSIEDNNQEVQQSSEEVNEEQKMDTMNQEQEAPSVLYQGHVQELGWQSEVSNGQTSGVIGQQLQLEALKIRLLSGEYEGGISYSAHVEDVGWQPYVSDGAVAGTEAHKKQLEAVKIKLTGEISEYYDVYYRIYTENIGWLDWAMNGEEAGTKGLAYSAEGIQVQLISKDNPNKPQTGTAFYENAIVRYQSHIADIGWQDPVANGATSGTLKLSKQIEAVKLSILSAPYTGGIKYETHIQDLGWAGSASDGSISGTITQGRRVEAIKIELTGELAQHYDVYYRVHVQEYGWLDWTKNGEVAGTEGLGYRIEAMEVKAYPKGVNPSLQTAIPYVQKGNVTYSSHVQDIGWQAEVSNGQTSGTVSMQKRMEAIKMSASAPGITGGIEYETHIQDLGWAGVASNGSISGTIGQGRRVEAIRIRLTGELSKYYDIYYRVQVQEFGWLAWTKNWDPAGTSKYSYRMEAIEIKLLPKQDPKAPAGGTAFREKPAMTKGDEIVAAARQHLGKPYAWGGNGPNSFDCSGLTSYVHRQFGISIPRQSAAQALGGTYVAKENLQPGDLIFYSATAGGGVSHVAIYIGNGQILHAGNEATGVHIYSMNIMNYVIARRYW